MHSGALIVESFAITPAEKLYISSNGNIIKGNFLQQSLKCHVYHIPDINFILCR